MNDELIPPPIKYFKALDGLRGYAVLMVLFFHAGLITWGWIGVQIFFVLSGFLITRNLLNSKGRPGYYKSFYVKRIIRIFPIYYLLLFSIIAWSYYRNASNADAWMYIIFIQNFKLGLQDLQTNFSDWFDHTWTLAVEEQFYIFFPVIVAGLSTRAFRIFSMTSIAMGLIAIITLPHLYNSRCFNVFNTVSCMAYLCGGALLATANPEKAARNTKTLVILSSTVIVAFILVTSLLLIPGSSQTSYTLKGQLYLISSLPLIVLIVQFLTAYRQRLIQLFFENKIIVYIGRISYGLYLYHYAVFILCFVHKLPLAASFAITFFISALSWHFIEKPFFGLRNQILGKQVANKTPPQTSPQSS